MIDTQTTSSVANGAGESAGQTQSQKEIAQSKVTLFNVLDDMRERFNELSISQNSSATGAAGSLSKGQSQTEGSQTAQKAGTGLGGATGDGDETKGNNEETKELTKAEEEEEKKQFEDQLDSIDSSLSVREENDIRVAVIGNVDSGKSTLVGVLTKGIMDDGRGSARMKVFNFGHEAQNGRTSSIAQEIMGFDE